MMRIEALEGWTSDQRNVVIASFLGWTLDAFDYFLLVFVLKDIAGECHDPGRGCDRQRRELWLGAGACRRQCRDRDRAPDGVRPRVQRHRVPNRTCSVTR